MNKRILSIACAVVSVMALHSTQAQAQSKFHFDVDYHYNLGLSTSFGTLSGHYGRSDYKMGGHSIHFTGRYDVSDMFSAGVGFGWDRYTEPEYNTLPVFATLRYKPVKSLGDAYCFVDLGGGVKQTDTYNSGFLMNFGVGYTKMFSAHFGLNFQVAYNYKVFNNAVVSAVPDASGNDEYFDEKRHSLSFGIGVTF